MEFEPLGLEFLAAVVGFLAVRAVVGGWGLLVERADVELVAIGPALLHGVVEDLVDRVEIEFGEGCGVGFGESVEDDFEESEAGGLNKEIPKWVFARVVFGGQSGKAKKPVFS